MDNFAPGCVLVTGGAGFIGSNLVRWILRTQPDVSVVNLDLLTYASNLESLRDVNERHGGTGDGRYYFVRGDIAEIEMVRALLREEARETLHGGKSGRRCPLPDAVINLAAESHVDRSIMGPESCLRTNVHGTFALLEACRAEGGGSRRPFRFLQVSTDEVYGSLAADEAPFTERSPLAPNSPYSASKASADFLVRAYIETFKLPAIISRCSNNYGPFQFPEKLIPLMITRALSDQPLPVYGDGLHIRDWIHVEDHVEALWAVLTRGHVGRVYNIGGESELPNIEVVRAILAQLGKPESLIRYVRDRPGHDRRYAIDNTRIETELGWCPARNFQGGLKETIRWYVENTTWWERILTEAHRAAATLYLTE